MKKLNQFKIAFITLNAVQEAPLNAPIGSRFPAGSLYVPADKVVKQNISDSYMLDLLQSVEMNGNDIIKVVNFSWSKDDVATDDALEINKPKILRILRDGVIIEGMNGVYSRFLRTPSQSRAGGAWLSCDPEYLREVLSFGLEKDYQTDFTIVPSKWDASMSLSCTTSNPVKFNRELRIQVIPDLYRKVICNVTTVKTKKGAPNPLGTEATKDMVYEKLSDKKSKKIGNPDIKYDLVTDSTDVEVAIGDGNSLATPYVFDVAGTGLQMTQAQKDLLVLLQFRGLPGCKGTMSKFDIAKYCDEHGIECLINIYGEKFDPREVDILMFESCFKWSDKFTSMEDYYNRTIRASFPVTRTRSQFFVKNRNKTNLISVQGIADTKRYNNLYIAPTRKRGSRKFKSICIQTGKFVSYTEQLPYFKDNTVLRVANVTKAKDEYHKLTYQYLQSLFKLDIDGLIPLTQPIYKAVANCTTDITVAKALFGMIHDEDSNKYSLSLVSKATELMELNQDTFRSTFVQRRILSTMTNLVNDQKRGSVMAKGGYYFIAPEPAVFFYQEGITKDEESGRWYVPILDTDTPVGLLEKGRAYLPGHIGYSLGFRSPLVHASEVARLYFGDGKSSDLEDTIEKWYGHLKGVILMNSYDTTAMRMGGANL